jgi:hypothetical protein
MKKEDVINTTFGKDYDVKGENNPMYGVHRIGKNAPHYKIPHTDVSKRIISDKQKAWQKLHGNPMKGKRRLDLSIRNFMNKGKKYSKEINQKKGLKGEKNHNWKGGIARLPYPFDWTKTLKYSIKERDNYICKLCLKKGNHVHHIDYDKKNCNPNNLITLCVTCHTKTNHHRGYWITYLRGLK